MSGILKKISDFIAGHPKLIILICVALLVPSALGYFATGINYDMLSYLPKDLNSVRGEQILDNTFHNAASSFIVMEKSDGLETVKLKEKIKAVDGVSSVIWVDDIADVTIPEEILPDVLKSVFYSADGNSTMMMVQYSGSASSDETMRAITEIKKILNKNAFISGLSVTGVETKEMADAQAPIYIAVAIATALAVLFCTTQSFAHPLILLTALMSAVVYNMGSNIIFGSISYITQCIGAILQLGVTMDYSIFLLDRFDEETIKTPDDKKAAMSRAITGTFTSLAGSSLTTVFGFLALCFMSFTLGLDIGLVMIKGVIFGVITVVTFLPALVLVFDRQINRLRHKPLLPSFGGLNSFLIKHRKIFAGVFAAIIIPAYVFSERAPVYYDMTKAMPADMDSVVALNKLKDEFNMANTYFIVTDDSVESAKLAAMSEEISRLDGISGVISLNTFVGSAIPGSILPDEIKKICSADGKQLMMVNSEYATSTDELGEQIKELKKIVFTYDPSAYVTGEGVMTDDLIAVTARDFRVTSIISIAAVGVLIAIFLKSASLPFLLVIAIELAIMLNKACCLVTGTEMAFISPVIISCVQLGATVDYAILLSTRYKEELQRSPDKFAAMKKAADESDRSIFQSALAFLAATFSVYLACDIDIIKGICALLARGAIISAIVIIFFLTPVLLCCEKLINRTSHRWEPAKVNVSGGNEDEKE